MEKITRKVRSSRMRKEVVRCVQSLVEKKNFLVLFEDGQNKEIGYFLLVYLSEKDEVDMEDSITLFLEKE